MSADQLALVDEGTAAVVPLQELPTPTNLGPFFLGGHRRARTKAVRDTVYAVGGPYYLAPAPAVELTDVLGAVAGQYARRSAGLSVTLQDVRTMHLRAAVLIDRIALGTDNPVDQVAAVHAAWVLQCWDRDHREHVLGQWQPDAITWPTLTAEPSSGTPLYARQEYAAWRAGRRSVRRG